MKTILLSLFVLFGTSQINNEISVEDNSEITYERVSSSKIKVKVTTNSGEPIGNVLVKIMQDKRHLGETYTDASGKAALTCKYVADNDKNVEIVAFKKGYKDVSIKGNLITSVTNFEFFLYENGNKENKPNTMNFSFEQEELRSTF
jgi:hypothetical protein